MKKPDITEKVIGFRYWRPETGWLKSQGIGEHYWGRGVNEAKCEAGVRSSQGFAYFTWSTAQFAFSDEPKVTKPHHAPGNGCTCGLHAYHKPLPGLSGAGPFTGEAMHILGAVKAWGRMEVHSNGFRAQYAEVLALAYNEAWPLAMVELTKELARSYEVDCVPMDRLEAFALEQGSPIPPDLYPGPKEQPKPKKVANPVKNPFLDYYQQQNLWSLRRQAFGK